MFSCHLAITCCHQKLTTVGNSLTPVKSHDAILPDTYGGGKNLLCQTNKITPSLHQPTTFCLKKFSSYGNLFIQFSAYSEKFNFFSMHFRLPQISSCWLWLWMSDVTKWCPYSVVSPHSLQWNLGQNVEQRNGNKINTRQNKKKKVSFDQQNQRKLQPIFCSK